MDTFLLSITWNGDIIHTKDTGYLDLQPTLLKQSNSPSKDITKEDLHHWKGSLVSPWYILLVSNVSQTVTFKIMMFLYTKKSHTLRFSMISGREHHQNVYNKSPTLRFANRDIKKIDSMSITIFLSQMVAKLYPTLYWHVLCVGPTFQ